MCENKVITKCYRLKMWQKRWTFSREAFGMRIQLLKEEATRKNTDGKRVSEKNSMVLTTKMANQQPNLRTQRYGILPTVSTKFKNSEIYVKLGFPASIANKKTWE